MKTNFNNIYQLSEYLENHEYSKEIEQLCKENNWVIIYIEYIGKINIRGKIHNDIYFDLSENNQDIISFQLYNDTVINTCIPFNADFELINNYDNILSWYFVWVHENDEYDKYPHIIFNNKNNIFSNILLIDLNI